MKIVERAISSPFIFFFTENIPGQQFRLFAVPGRLRPDRLVRRLRHESAGRAHETLVREVFGSNILKRANPYIGATRVQHFGTGEGNYKTVETPTICVLGRDMKVLPLQGCHELEFFKFPYFSRLFLKMFHIQIEKKNTSKKISRKFL